MRPEKIGRLGEEIVARVLGYRRVPFSGAQWPNREDLIREIPIGDLAGTIDMEIAQVKTTADMKLINQYLALAEYADAEGASAMWFEVYLGPDKAWVFEKRLVAIEPRGIEAIGVRHGRARTAGKVSKDGRHRAGRFRRRVQADDPRKGRRRDGLA